MRHIFFFCMVRILGITEKTPRRLGVERLRPFTRIKGQSKRVAEHKEDRDH